MTTLTLPKNMLAVGIGRISTDHHVGEFRIEFMLADMSARVHDEIHRDDDYYSTNYVTIAGLFAVKIGLGGYGINLVDGKLKSGCHGCLWTLQGKPCETALPKGDMLIVTVWNDIARDLNEVEMRSLVPILHGLRLTYNVLDL